MLKILEILEIATLDQSLIRTVMIRMIRFWLDMILGVWRWGGRQRPPSNPDGVDYPIPGNDDAIRAVKLLCSVMADAVLAGRAEQVAFADQKVAAVEAVKQ